METGKESLYKTSQWVKNTHQKKDCFVCQPLFVETIHDDFALMISRISWDAFFIFARIIYGGKDTPLAEWANIEVICGKLSANRLSASFVSSLVSTFKDLKPSIMHSSAPKSNSCGVWVIVTLFSSQNFIIFSLVQLVILFSSIFRSLPILSWYFLQKWETQDLEGGSISSIWILDDSSLQFTEIKNFFPSSYLCFFNL